MYAPASSDLPPRAVRSVGLTSGNGHDVGALPWVWWVTCVQSAVFPRCHETLGRLNLLPGSDGEALKAWLAAHPQVEVITRDRLEGVHPGRHLGRPTVEAGGRPVPPADQRARGGGEDPVPTRPGHPGRTRGGERPAGPPPRLLPSPCRRHRLLRRPPRSSSGRRSRRPGASDSGGWPTVSGGSGLGPVGPLGSRQSVRQRARPAAARRKRITQHEPAWELLGQRVDGEFLCEPEEELVHDEGYATRGEARGPGRSVRKLGERLDAQQSTALLPPWARLCRMRSTSGRPRAGTRAMPGTRSTTKWPNARYDRWRSDERTGCSWAATGAGECRGADECVRVGEAACVEPVGAPERRVDAVGRQTGRRGASVA